MVPNCTLEVEVGKRFGFGKNWEAFLPTLSEERVGEALRATKSALALETLEGSSFLDIGSGSGLFSLAAMRMGAKRVHSFDYDPQSVGCTWGLKNRFCPREVRWSIEQGSILDLHYLRSLGEFDIVYSWGVLHHTGNMWRALENVIPLVRTGGLLFISIYNHQPFWSDFWLSVKRLHNRMPPLGRRLLNVGFFLFFATVYFLADLVRLRNPRHRYAGLGRRGMSLYVSVVDWIGGFPFEVAKPEEIFRFYRDRGFALKELKTCGGRHGCNEFVFIKASGALA